MLDKKTYTNLTVDMIMSRQNVFMNFKISVSLINMEISWNTEMAYDYKSKLARIYCSHDVFSFSTGSSK